MSKAIVPFQQDMSLSETLQLGKVLAESGFFQDSRQAAQAVTKILAGRELGFGPIASMTNIYIYKGRICIYTILMGAAIKRSGKYDYKVRQHDNDGCEIEFFENGQSVGISRFNKSDAQRAELLGKDTWRKHPANMYFARALSNGAKWYCPDIFSGPIYTPEELGAEVDAEGEIIEAESVATGHEPVITELEQREPMSREADRKPVFKNWPELKQAAVSRLGFDHIKHVENALKQVSDGDASSLTLEVAWQLLVEHQESKEAEVLEEETCVGVFGDSPVAEAFDAMQHP